MYSNLKAMKKILLVFFLTASFGCKQKSEAKQEQQINEPRDAFVLKINTIIDDDDVFTLFFLEEGQDNITTKNSVSVNVKNSPSPQELTFKVKEGILPTKLFLKFGNEQKKQRIFILSAQINFGEKSFIISREKFYQFFIPNKFINYDVENAIAIGKEVDGEYSPWFGSREVLIDKIFYDFE